MKLISAAVLGAGALIASALLYNGWEERLQADCHAMAQIFLGGGQWEFAHPAEWDHPELEQIRKGIAHVLSLTDENRAYCNW